MKDRCQGFRPRCLAQRPTLLTCAFMLSISFVSLVHWHFAIPHVSKPERDQLDLCGSTHAAHQPWRLKSKTLLCSHDVSTNVAASATHTVLETVEDLAGAAASALAAQAAAMGATASKAVTRAALSVSGVKHSIKSPPWAPSAGSSNADSFACHYFQNLNGMDHASWELQQPAARHSIALLHELHPRHRCMGVAAPTGVAGSRSAAQAAAALEKLREAVAVLQTLACGSGVAAPAPLGTIRADFTAEPRTPQQAQLDKAAAAAKVRPTKAEEKLPAGAFAAVRRLTLAVLQQLWLEPSDSNWHQALMEVAPSILSDFQRAHLCAAARRSAMELFHVSKSGGTTLCQLARFGTRIARNFKEDANCLQEGFGDEPKWTTIPVARPRLAASSTTIIGGNTRAQRFAGQSVNTHVGRGAVIGRGVSRVVPQKVARRTMVTRQVTFAHNGDSAAAATQVLGGGRGRKLFNYCSNWAAYDCASWLATPEVTCAARQQALSQQGVDFYSNEHALHGGTDQAGSAHTCPQFESIIALRDPLLRAEAHIIQTISVYTEFSNQCASSPSDRDMYTLDRNLQFWKKFAPSIVDNYFTRSLLGKHFHCRPFGSLTTDDAHHAQLKLMTFDHIFVLGDDLHNDPVFRLGLGWPETLRQNRLRWKNETDPATSFWEQGLSSTGSRIEKAGAFPAGSSAQLAQWNLLDVAVYDWGKAALQLDAEFLVTAAVYDHRYREIAPTTLVTAVNASVSTASSSATAISATVKSALQPPAPVRTNINALQGRWDPVKLEFVVVKERVTPLRLPVNSTMLLFHAEAGLSLDGVVSVTAAARQYEFVCLDSSHNGTRKVQPRSSQLW